MREEYKENIETVKLLIDTLDDKDYREKTTKEELDFLYQAIQKLSKTPMRLKDRLSFVPYVNKIDRIKTRHIKTKSLCSSLLEKITDNYVRDKSEYLSRRDRQLVTSTLEKVLEEQRVLISHHSLEFTLELLEYIRTLDIKDLERYLIDDNDDILQSIEDKFLYFIEKYSKEFELGFKDKKGKTKKTINNNLGQEPRTRPKSAPLGGGGLNHFLLPKELSLCKIKKFSLSILNMKCSFIGVSAVQKLTTSKLAALLTHIYFSKLEFVPISRYFLEDNGYEILTQAKGIDLETGKIYHSLDVLEMLGLGLVLDQTYENSREVSLTMLAEAIIGVLSLETKNISTRDIDLRDGDLSYLQRDYQYYIEDDIIPNIELIDSFLDANPSTNVNLSSYVKEMKESFPILEYTREQYLKYIFDNIQDIRLEIDSNIPVVSNFSRDVMYLSSGYCLTKKYKGKTRDLSVNYTNVFRLSYTGRLFQRYGIQGITKYSKSIIHKDNINYDIPSSQLRVLIQYLEYIKDTYTLSQEELEVYSNIEWLKKYISDKTYRDEIISELNIKDSEWKKAIYSIVFGSNIDSKYNKTALNLIVLRAISHNKYFNKEKFYFYLGMLSDLVKLWLKYLDNYKEDVKLPMKDKKTLLDISTKYKLNIDPDDYFFNGINFVRKDYIRTKKQLSSYFLQGLESSFILNLIKLVPDLIISYEFDGVVVNKDIPKYVVKEARLNSGFKLGEVIVKDFV